MKISYTLILMLISYNIFCQTNLIPNYSFEYASSGHELQNCFQSNDGSTLLSQYFDSQSYEDNFNSDIANWSFARHGDSHRKMPVWIDRSGSCFTALECNCIPPIYYTPSQRYMLLSVEYKNYVNCKPKRWSAIRNGFDPQVPLSINKAYTLRYKYLPFIKHESCDGGLTCGASPTLSVWLTNYAYYWDSDDESNHKLRIDYLQDSYANHKCMWQYREVDFILGTGLDNLLNIVFECNEQGFLLDDVELFEKCPNEKYIDNKNYLWYVYNNGYPINETASNMLYASYNGPVHINDGAKVTFSAGEQIQLMPGFHAEHGSEFHAYISPCDLFRNPILYFDSSNKFISNFDTTDFNEISFMNDINYDITCFIYPTISNGTILIQYEKGILENASVQVIDILGKIVFNNNLKNQSIQELNLEKLHQGLYYIKVYNDSYSFSYKLIIQK